MVEQGDKQTKTVTVANTSDIPIGQMKGFTVEEKNILIANIAGEYYCMDAICSHAQGYLPAGRLDNGVLTCPIHGAQFDVTTGCMVIYISGKVRRNVNLNCRLQAGHGVVDLHTYEVIVEGNEIKVRI